MLDSVMLDGKASGCKPKSMTSMHQHHGRPVSGMTALTVSRVRHRTIFAHDTQQQQVSRRTRSDDDVGDADADVFVLLAFEAEWIKAQHITSRLKYEVEIQQEVERALLTGGYGEGGRW